MDQIKDNVLKAVNILNDKKGLNIKLLDVKGLVPYTDYLVLTTGMSERHVGALAKNLRKDLSKFGVNVKNFEGSNKSGWILLDFVDFVVHIFSRDKREFYNLDKIWDHANKIDIDN